MLKYIRIIIGPTVNIPDGKDIYFEVDGERLNAWQTVEAYCDAITAIGNELEDNYEANFAVTINTLLRIFSPSR